MGLPCTHTHHSRTSHHTHYTHTPCTNTTHVHTTPWTWLGMARSRRGPVGRRRRAHIGDWGRLRGAPEPGRWGGGGRGRGGARAVAAACPLEGVGSGWVSFGRERSP